MPAQRPLFTPFSRPVSPEELPERFTFPFYYQPHPLCEEAAAELQQQLQGENSWQHDFGVEGESDAADGKMFGVLVAESPDGVLGYLSAFSGKLADQTVLPGFVPPVFDMFAPGGLVEQNHDALAAMTAEVEQRSADPELTRLDAELIAIKAAAQQALDGHKALMSESRKARKAKRKAAAELDDATRAELQQQLAQQSVIEKLQLRDLKLHWDAKVNAAQQAYDALAVPLADLKSRRRERSSGLQRALFDQYRFLNIRGEQKSLGAIFSETPRKVPPSGAGDCAAPRLLHYAFTHGYRPLAMAEFWWGVSPKSEIRQHGQYYPACQGKCHPILGHMLEGMTVDENPLLANPAEGKALDIIYQDEHMLVLNKPSGFLSVPGKTIQDSVAWRMEQLFPRAKGHLIVHRLDMATSGLMVIALNARAHKRLQKQFINRTVEKRYEAVLDGELTEPEGSISLPMRGDYDDLPRQLVCHEHGKPAETFWRQVSVEQGRSRVHLYPKTGRTHQLRVHCAHKEGLGTPIVGDVLYGQSRDRLHLHAGLLALNHPITGEPLRFEVAAEF